MYEFSTIKDIKEAQEIKEEWDILNKKTNSDIFSTWSWISTWWNFFGEDHILNIITIKKNNELIGIIPLMKSFYDIKITAIKKIEFIGVPDSDFNNFIIEEINNDSISHLLNYIKKDVKYDFIAFKDVLQNKPFTKKLQEISEIHGMKSRKTSQCPYMYLPDTYDTFYGGIKKKLRKNIRNRTNRLNKLGEVKYVDHSNFQSINEAMDILYMLHSKRYETKNEKGYFYYPKIMNFHKKIATELHAKDCLHIGFLLVDETPVAAEYSFLYNNTVYAYQSGFDTDYSEYGVGRICELNHIRSAIDKKMKIYSWTRGFESYIADWTDKFYYNQEFRIYDDSILSKLLRTIDNNRELLGNIVTKIPYISKEQFKSV